MLNLIRLKCHETYRINKPTELKLLTSLRLGLSHLNFLQGDTYTSHKYADKNHSNRNNKKNKIK